MEAIKLDQATYCPQTALQLGELLEAKRAHQHIPLQGGPLRLLPLNGRKFSSVTGVISYNPTYRGY